jgi:hypothetical protein
MRIVRYFVAYVAVILIFSDELEDAKPLTNDGQFRMIQYGTSFKLEKEYI